MQGAPEIAEFATKRKTAKQALKSTKAKTVKKQFQEDHFTSVGASLDERSPVEAKITKTNLL